MKANIYAQTYIRIDADKALNVPVGWKEVREVDKALREGIDQLHAELCRCLADPRRISILYALSEGPRNVSELTEILDMNRATVSRHLKVLRDGAMVSTERDGVSIYYSLADDRVIQALDLLRGVLAEILAQRKTLAEAME
jgi:DNA-binding transcriptional ArsR family regulator